MNDKDNTYQPPAIAVYEIAAERGFAGSGEVNDYDDGGEFQISSAYERIRPGSISRGRIPFHPGRRTGRKAL